MNREDVEKLSTAAKGKINLLNSNFGKYFMRAIMAGFFIDVAMIYSNVVGNVFSQDIPGMGEIPWSHRVLYCGPADRNGRRRAVYR